MRAYHAPNGVGVAGGKSGKRASGWWGRPAVEHVPARVPAGAIVAACRAESTRGAQHDAGLGLSTMLGTTLRRGLSMLSTRLGWGSARCSAPGSAGGSAPWSAPGGEPAQLAWRCQPPHLTTLVRLRSELVRLRTGFTPSWRDAASRALPRMPERSRQRALEATMDRRSSLSLVSRPIRAISHDHARSPTAPYAAFDAPRSSPTPERRCLPRGGHPQPRFFGETCAPSATLPPCGVASVR